MTKLDDAKKLWQRKQAQYRKTTKLRTAYTGDGRGDLPTLNGPNTVVPVWVAE